MKSPLHIIVFLASAVLMVFTLQKGVEHREKNRSKDVGTEYLKRSKMLTGGFDSVFADFIWIRTNLRNQDTPKNMSKAQEEDHIKNMANRDFAGFLKVVKLDPTFENAYDSGISRIENILPDQAITLAEMAIKFMPEKKKKFAEVASNVASRYKKDNNETLRFLRMCVMNGGPSKDYIGRRYLRTKLRLEDIDPHKTDLINMSKIISVYHELYMQTHGLSEEMSAYGGEDTQIEEGAELPEDMSNPDDLINYEWIMPELRKEVKRFLTRVGTEKNNVPAPSVRKVEQIFESLMPSPYACKTCYLELQPGDVFCSFCGTKAVPYGICLKDQTVLKGKFCHVCGDPAPKKKAIKKRSAL